MSKRGSSHDDTRSRSRRPRKAPPPAELGNEWRTVLGFVAVHVLLCTLLFDPNLHTGGDNAQYIMLSESLLTPFDGYTESYGPGPPKLHTKYPPGYPILLAPVSALLGRNIVAYKLVSILMTAGAVAVFCLLTRARFRRPVWLALCAAFALNPVVIDYSHLILTEAPFLLVSLLALLAIDRDRDRGLGRWFWIGIVAGVWCFYMRQIGAIFLAGISLAYLAQRRWRRFLVHGVIGAGLTLPWFLRARLAGYDASPYLSEFRLSSVYNPEAGEIGLGGFVARLFDNILIYSVRELPRVWVGSDSPWAQTIFLDLIAVTVVGLVIVGLVRSMRKGLSAATLYLVLSSLATFLFPQVVTDVRYLMPLVPLFLIYATGGIQWMAELMERRTNRPLARVAPMALLLLLAGVGLSAHIVAIPTNATVLAQVRGGDPYAAYDRSWRDFMQAADWVRDNTPEDAVVTVRKPRLFRLLSGRRSVVYPFSTDADSVLSAVRETDYVVVGWTSRTTPTYLVPAVYQSPDEFEVVFRTPDPPTYVLRVVK